MVVRGVVSRRATTAVAILLPLCYSLFAFDVLFVYLRESTSELTGEGQKERRA